MTSKSKMSVSFLNSKAIDIVMTKTTLSSATGTEEIVVVMMSKLVILTM